MTSGLAGGLPSEITRALDTPTGSAVRAAASPGDPAQAFGLELLGTLVNDELLTLPAAHELASATPDMLFDNQGRVRTGVVDAQAPVAQKALQLAERLLAMGVPADEATATAMAAVGPSVGRSVASTPPVALGPDGLDDPGNDAPRIVVTGHELPRDAQGNRYQTDAQGRTLVMLDGGGLLGLGSTVVPVLDSVALPGMSVLRMLANAATPVRAAAALLFVPGNIGQSAPTVDLVDGLRYEPPPPGEVWGRQLELQADGSWLALPGRFHGNPTADGVGFSVLSEDEVRRLRTPISTPAVPPPPYTTLPLPAWLDRPEVLPPSGRGAPAGPSTTVTPGAPVQDWRDLVIDRNGRKLGDALAAAGRPQPAPGYVPHHVVLVEGGGADMQAARDRLAALGIDIDSAANGVWLPSHRSEYGSPGAYHERLHNGVYYDTVARALDRATNRDEAVASLQRIGQRLSEGNLVGVRPRPAPKENLP